MTRLISPARQYLKTRNDEGYTSEPTGVVISIDDQEEQFEITGRFAESQDDSKNGTQRTSVLVPESDTLAEIFGSFFTEVASKIAVDQGDLEILSVSEKVSGMESFDEWEFYTHKTADARILVCVEHEEVPEEVEEQLQTATYRHIKETVDPALLQHQVQNVRLLYSDTRENYVQKVEASIATPRPQLYYKRISSATEFHLKKRASENNSYTTIVPQDTYSVGYFLQDDSVAELTELQKVGTTILREFVETMFATEYDEYLLEGSNIFIGDFAEDKYESEGIRYYIHIPIVGDNVGRSKEQN